MSVRDWLDRERRRGRRGVSLATGLVACGAVAAVLMLGVLLDRAGSYGRTPELALGVWLAALGALAGALVLGWHKRRAVSREALASAVERGAGLRRGALSGLAEPVAQGSADLSALADRRMAEWLAVHGAAAAATIAAPRRRDLRQSAVVAAVGVLLFAASGPQRAGSALWHPVAAVRRVHGPVLLAIDRTTVRRGETVTLTVLAAGRREAALYERAPGEPWHAVALALDSAGRATRPTGPLDADRFFYAASGGRASDTARVHVTLPAFVTDLELAAVFPSYLERPDEPLALGPDTLPLPQGTRIATAGRASVPLERAAWVSGDRRVPLTATPEGFRGALPIETSGVWTLAFEGADGPVDAPAGALVVRAVADSAPTVTVPVPGVDTTAPTSLQQPLVLDLRDDHKVVRAEVVSRRVSRLGIAGPARTDTVPLPAGGLERAIVQWVLDLNGRGFLPGDTAFFRVRAWDNAPRPHVAETREYALRLPSLAELRAAARDEVRSLASATDSAVRAQQELGRATQDLARERERTAATSRDGDASEQLGYRAAERAGEIGADQRAVIKRAEELRRRVEELARTAEEAGLTDPAWLEQVAELRRLLEQAITPELEATLRRLEEAMQRLDPEAVRDALQRLAAQQDQLRRELERSRTLFERAAIEGELTTLAEDAAELAQRQRDWIQAMTRTPDTALARPERQLSSETDSLAQRLAAVERAARAAGADATGDSAAARASQAQASMDTAAAAAAAAVPPEAVRAGEQAARQLDPLAQSLKLQRDALRETWRRDVLAAMDRALVETAQLAQRQEEITQRLADGDAGADVRGQQAAVRDGLDRVLERLQDAAGKHALVSPRLGAALGYAKGQMTGALDQLQQGSPNTRGAALAAGQALDGLNNLAMQLVSGRSAIANAQSGSGLQEAIEQLAQLAQQQGAMAGQGGGLLPLMQAGGASLMTQLRQLAAAQRALAAQLERMRAQGQASGAGAYAEEANDIARSLEHGVLTREIVARQERLYRRLLDAGRTLRSSEEDDNQERVSQTARPGNELLPPATGVPDARGPRYRYPTWEELRDLSPADRRLVMDYFRRLNAERRP
jgi:hypothetical protein